MLVGPLSVAALSSVLARWHAAVPTGVAERVSSVRMTETIAICQGGSCGTHGGTALLNAACVLAAGCDREDGPQVKTINCCGECPDGVMIRPAIHIPSYVAQASTQEEAMHSAEEAVVCAGAEVVPQMRTVYTLQEKAELALKKGTPVEAIEAIGAVLDAVPDHVFEPWQPGIEHESLSWLDTSWEESLHGSKLVLAESTANFEFGTVGDQLLLVDCEVDEKRRTVAGRWESSEGAEGEFLLTMSEDGRFFSGAIDPGEPSEKLWQGMRLGVGTGVRRSRRGETPPLKIAWLHELLLCRARLHLDGGNTDLALEDARRATRLCCRAASGYGMLAEVADAAGNVELAKWARQEKRWLQSFA